MIWLKTNLRQGWKESSGGLVPKVQCGDGRCRNQIFKGLMSSLVESTMICGVEILECNRNVEALQQTFQLKAARLFFGVGTHHCKSIPAVGAGRFTSGLSRQAQMCCILVQGPHQPNV